MSWSEALARTVTGMHYDLVDVERSAGGLLRVTIDRLPGHSYATGPGEFVLVEDCELVTRQLQYLLEVEAVDYARLEVSSPGLDRPLKKPADWQRFVGSEVEITLREAFQGRKRWRGALAAGSSAEQWRLVLPAAPTPSRSAVRKATKAVAGQAPAAEAGASSPQQVLDFTLDEVREARLVPVVDFKGRRGRMQDDAGAPGALAREMNGGLQG